MAGQPAGLAHARINLQSTLSKFRYELLRAQSVTTRHFAEVPSVIATWLCSFFFLFIGPTKICGRQHSVVAGANVMRTVAASRILALEIEFAHWAGGGSRNSKSMVRKRKRHVVAKYIRTGFSKSGLASQAWAGK